ncbi:hypothetical protein [Hymenobacter sp. 102]|uniref:hypothetical protein n=1 Tax=Hymenobacter sp. 102 TaxID=3403152 RepID=UPI003CECCF82
MKEFLGKALCQDFFSESFTIMRDAYIETSFEEDKNEVPNVLGPFCEYILKIYYGFTREPKSALLDYYDRASMHLNEIDTRINNIEDSMKRISLDNIPAIRQKELPVLDYYLRHNKRAREEVLAFIKEEVRTFTIGKCVQGFEFYNAYPYHYDYASTSYEVKHPTMISNKFGDVDSAIGRTLPEMYKNRKGEFDQFLETYLDRNDIVNSIRNACDVNYVFSKRVRLVEEALLAYESGNNLAFSSMCFVIVEGVFHDLCILLGESENDILGKGFQEKVNLLYEKHELYFHYEYYSFVFRILRNKVAHGVAEATELNEVADFLLLDLYDVIELSKSKRIPMNQKHYMLYSVLSTPKFKNYEYVVGAVILKDIEMPDFFDTSDADALIVSAIQEEEFWVYLDGLFTSRFDYDKGIAMEVLKRLKRFELPVVNEKCKEMFRNYHDVKIKFDKEQYIKGVFQYTYY